MADQVTITLIGSKGDGVGESDGQQVFVPFSLPGELVSITGNGNHRKLISIEEPSSSRIDPVCPYFGTCGGCQLQHMANDPYLRWKTGLLVDQLSKAGIRAGIEPMMQFDTASRRRAVFNGMRIGATMEFGFSERRSHSIVSIDDCNVLVPEIVGQLDVLKRLATILGHRKKAFRVNVLSTQTGLDVCFQGLENVSKSQRSRVIESIAGTEVARVSNGDEILFEMRKPELELGGMAVVPAPGAFVQAVRAAEQYMSRLVSEHLSGCKQVADLYCGMGTFALKLAEKSIVYAAEADHAAIGALDQAWRGSAGKLKEIRSEVRNLERRPLGFQELNRFEGVVFDPPRAGAEAQCRQIAKSSVKKIAAVSCNPVTLARDLSILIDGGFKIVKMFPLDQFRFTPHLEVIALLERGKK